MKRKLKHSYWHDELYRVNYIFILNVKDDKEVEKILKKYYPKTYKFYLEEKKHGGVSIAKSSGKCIQSVSRHIILIRKHDFLKESMWWGILAHECLHSVMRVFYDRGLEYVSNDTNEHYTYYLELLINKSHGK